MLFIWNRNDKYFHTLQLNSHQNRHSIPVAPSKEIQESPCFWIPFPGFRILYHLYLGFRLQMLDWRPDSLHCKTDSKIQDPRCHKQRFRRLRIPQAKISRITKSGFSYMGRRPVFKPKRCKNLPFGTAHTYIPFYKGFSPPPDITLVFTKL